MTVAAHEIVHAQYFDRFFVRKLGFADAVDEYFSLETWKLTSPNHLVRFERGEPICMIVPYPRGLLDELAPRKELLENNAELAASYGRWSADRDEFHRQMATGDREVLERGWQKDYFQGRDPGSERVEIHQTKLNVRPFE